MYPTKADLLYDYVRTLIERKAVGRLEVNFGPSGEVRVSFTQSLLDADLAKEIRAWEVAKTR